MLEIGSKVQVYRGIAKRTSGGLTRSQIERIEDPWGNTRYKAKKQQKFGKRNNERSKWSKATHVAYDFLKKPNNEPSGITKVTKDIAKYFQENSFVPMKKPAKTKKTKFSPEERLYLVTKLFYENEVF